MSVEIEIIRADRLAEYAAVPMVCHVRSVLEVVPVNGGIEGCALQERPVPCSYLKDYDAIDGGPLTWPTRFDLKLWSIWLARYGGQTVGGAAVASNVGSASVPADEGDLAVLWDIRVRPRYQLQGIGSALFRTALDWIKSEGCKTLKVETQHVNVAACRFYSKMGCTLSAVDHFTYRHRPEIAHEVMLTWRLHL